jgi:hypothetical protein
MEHDPHDDIAQVFSRFARAVLDADVAAFRSLVVQDVPAQEELFVRNCRHVGGAGGRLELRRIQQVGETAEVAFDVTKADGTAGGEGCVTFSLEAAGWRLRAL